MTNDISPKEIQNQLDSYIKRQQDLLDKEVAKLIEKNNAIAHISAEEYIEQAKWRIEHPSKPIPISERIKASLLRLANFAASFFERTKKVFSKKLTKR